MSAEMARISTGGHMPPPAAPARYDGHDLCHCSHFKASHDPSAGTCYDPASECPCRKYDPDLPLRRTA